MTALSSSSLFSGLDVRFSPLLFSRLDVRLSTVWSAEEQTILSVSTHYETY